MTDIFISYSQSNTKKVSQIVNKLEQEGYSVWWDQYIEAGQNAHKLITHHLNKAKCVIVVWSKQSLTSDWVLAEADKARINNKILPVRIDTVTLEPPFNIIQTIDLSESTLRLEILLLKLKKFINCSAKNTQETRYIDLTDGTITDKVTQLMWQKFPKSSNKYNWKTANALSKRCDLGGHTDWRLPSIKELKTLVDQDKNGSINSIFFPKTPNSWFWSVSYTGHSTPYIKVIDFSNGSEYPCLKSKKGYVRYVRCI